MLRLRTSTGLSLLAMAIGIAGTAWLSTLTSQLPARPMAASGIAQRSVSRVDPRPAQTRAIPVSVVTQRPRNRRSSPVEPPAASQAQTITPPIPLIPLTTPSDNSRPWYQLQGHLDGKVVLHLTIDSDGQVLTAAMRQSSGDRILDDHALRSVRHWRFAVPSDHPHGISGDLPMRFASRSGEMAQAP